ncbi:MAG: hypothetical protein ACR2MN_13610 [Acidimicrobiales bacterium]
MTHPGLAASVDADEVLGACGAVVRGRTMYDHMHGWGEKPGSQT